MKTLFKDIFDYHFKVNQKLIAEIEKEKENLPERTYPLFCHVLNAHQIWNARILNSETFGVNQVHQLSDCRPINLDNYKTTLKIIEAELMDRIVEYHNSKGAVFKTKLSDILFHIANHSTHHKGQIIADFRSSGIAPLVTDYIFYKR